MFFFLLYNSFFLKTTMQYARIGLHLYELYILLLKSLDYIMPNAVKRKIREI